MAPNNFHFTQLCEFYEHADKQNKKELKMQADTHDMYIILDKLIFMNKIVAGVKLMTVIPK